MSLKNSILAELEASRDRDLSGQYLADKNGVSRNAVWKAINQLKDEGHKILSSTNRGYRLSPESDRLSAQGIRSFLPSGLSGLEIYAFTEVDSTNNEAKRRLADGLKSSALFVAEAQTAGRGRMGRSFYSPSGTGLYMTLVTHPERPISDSVFITTAASVAVVRAVEALTDKKPLIKWVNDIYLDGKKICGILTEAVSNFESGITHSIIIGVGLNVTTEDFPPEISGTASSLGGGLSRNRLAAEIAANILKVMSSGDGGSYLDEYRARSMVIGRHITYIKNGESYSARALAIDDGGGLVIKNADGSEDVLRSGEISVRVT